MLTYIIDAFNLIYKVDELASAAAPHASLLQFLRSHHLTGSRNNRVVVVFDGHDNPDVAGEREYEIVFSGGRTADDVIKDRVSGTSNRSQIVVVSDDRGVTSFVKAEGAKVKSVGEFVKSSGRRLNVSVHDEKEISYEERQKIKEELEHLWAKDPPYDFKKKKDR